MCFLPLLIYSPSSFFMRRGNLPARRDKPPVTWHAYKWTIQFCNSNSEYDNSRESTSRLTEITASDNLTNDVWILFFKFLSRNGKNNKQGCNNLQNMQHTRTARRHIMCRKALCTAGCKHIHNEWGRGLQTGLITSRLKTAEESQEPPLAVEKSEHDVRLFCTCNSHCVGTFILYWYRG